MSYTIIVKLWSDGSIVAEYNIPPYDKVFTPEGWSIVLEGNEVAFYEFANYKVEIILVELPPEPVPIDESELALDEVFKIYPEYEKDILPEVANLIDLSRVSNSGVRVYEFNKIRFKLAGIQQRNGYPMRLHHTVMFFDLVMFSLPFYTKLFVTKTIDSWEKSIQIDGPEGKKIDTLPESFRFRKVFIYDIPTEFLAMILQGVQILGLYYWVELAMQLTNRPYWLFKNLVSYGGLNNKMIVCNWDKIIKMLNDNGY